MGAPVSDMKLHYVYFEWYLPSFSLRFLIKVKMVDALINNLSIMVSAIYNYDQIRGIFLVSSVETNIRQTVALDSDMYFEFRKLVRKKFCSFRLSINKTCNKNKFVNGSLHPNNSS